MLFTQDGYNALRASNPFNAIQNFHQSFTEFTLYLKCIILSSQVKLNWVDYCITEVKSQIFKGYSEQAHKGIN